MYNLQHNFDPNVNEIINYLICPSCHNKLSRYPNLFSCTGCARTYPILDGIPRFILEFKPFIEETRKSFDLQWEMSRLRGEYNQFNPEYKNKLITYLLDDAMLESDYFKGKKVLDAGCGIGRFTYALTQLGAYVTAIDYNDIAVKIAYEYFKDNSQVKVIQADIFNLPFPENSFDFILSWGVLHHTGNTKEAFDKLVPLLKNNGILFVMLYEKYNAFKLWFTDQVRKLTLKKDKEKLYNLCIFLSKICRYSIFRIPLKPFIDIGSSAEGNYDAFAKAINQHHSAEEVFYWYLEHGFSEITLNASRRFRNPLFQFLQGKWGGTVRMRGTKRKVGASSVREVLHLVSQG
ncbi:MAG: methyltransferase domain-containing protein [Candidatus Omnitrophota bacterium]|nr:methyltransferase domain-containing protein [Candidatus Omnitrophota bacterium]